MLLVSRISFTFHSDRSENVSDQFLSLKTPLAETVLLVSAALGINPALGAASVEVPRCSGTGFAGVTVTGGCTRPMSMPREVRAAASLVRMVESIVIGKVYNRGRF